MQFSFYPAFSILKKYGTLFVIDAKVGNYWIYKKLRFKILNLI